MSTRSTLVQTVPPNIMPFWRQAPTGHDGWGNIGLAPHARHRTLETLLPGLELDAHCGILFTLQPFVEILLLEAEDQTVRAVVRARLAHALCLVRGRYLADRTWPTARLISISDFVAWTPIAPIAKRGLLPN